MLAGEVRAGGSRGEELMEALLKGTGDFMIMCPCVRVAERTVTAAKTLVVENNILVMVMGYRR